MEPEMKPITDRSVWTGKDLEADSSWRLSVTEDQRRELNEALERVKERGLTLAEITRNDFPLPGCQELHGKLLRELRMGRGLTLLSGFPVEGYDFADLEILYWGFCAHLGTGVTQNREAGLIHYITDGALAPKQGARVLGKPNPSALHVDLSDCVGLFCVRQAPDDPRSTAASSMMVYNEILREHPEYLPRLCEGFVWNRVDTHPGESPFTEFRIPAFSAIDGTVSCRFHPGWIRGGMKKAGQEFGDDLADIFRFIAETANRHRLAFPLHRGDIALFNNYTVFHGKEGYAPIEEEEEKRVLLRIWLDLPDVRPFADEARVRYGAIRHGRLGWTAADLLAGRHQGSHRRDEIGVPVVP